MALTPLLMLLNEKLLQPRLGTRERSGRSADVIEEQNPVIMAGFGRVGSIVGRFLAANGIGATVLEFDSDHVEVLRKMGRKVFYGDASRIDLLRAAGAEHAKILLLAIDDHAKTMQMVETIRAQFPNLKLLVRAKGRLEAYELVEEGLEHVYRETFDTSLRMGVDTLHLLGMRAYRAHRAAQRFRRDDEAALLALAGMQHDRKQYITVAREHMQLLESTMRQDLEDREDERDAGWDAESLREDFGRRT